MLELASDSSTPALRALRLRRACIGVLSLLMACSLACADPSPESVLEEASEELGKAREELAAADEGVEVIRNRMRELENKLADAERVRREAAKHVKEADSKVAKLADDETLFRAVQRRLLEDGDLEGAAVSAHVANRVVTLTGQVHDAAASKRAVAVAESAPGVAAVVNQLRVPGAPAPAAAH